MKVNRTGGVEPIKNYSEQLKKAEIKNKSGEQVQSDTLEISSEARKIQSYKDVLAKMPAGREDLVALLKKQIQEGTYLPDSKKIASGILQERLIDKVVQKD